LQNQVEEISFIQKEGAGGGWGTSEREGWFTKSSLDAGTGGPGKGIQTPNKKDGTLVSEKKRPQSVSQRVWRLSANKYAGGGMTTEKKQTRTFKAAETIASETGVR